MSELFDDIARMLAGPLPRRRAIFQAAGLLAGAALAGLRPAISEADTVCCDAQNHCCPPNVACCGEGPRGPICCGRGQICCNGVCCSPTQCCRGTCLPDRIHCCDTDAQRCGRFPCCPTGTTCCDPHVGLCCPAGQVCIVSGGRNLCGQPCGNTVGAQNFCVKGEVCCGSVCCPTGQECCPDGQCRRPELCAHPTCPTGQCAVILTLPATTGNSEPPNLTAWLDTGINLIAGCGPVIISASGTANYCENNPPACITNPNGVGTLPGCTGPAIAPDCNAGIGALIGVVGTGAPFKIGSALIFTPSGSGHLFLAFNDLFTQYFDNTGSYQVSIVYPC